MNAILKTGLAIALTLSLTACGDEEDKTDTADTADSGSATTPPTNTDDSGVTGGGGQVTSNHGTTGCDTFSPVDQTASPITTTDPNNPVYYDLDTNSVVTASDGWEISMYTWNIELNAAAGVEVAVFWENWESYGNFCSAPPHGFVSDAFGMEDWFQYDMSAPPSDSITPADVIYFIKSSEGTHYKLRMDSYYVGGATDHRPVWTFAEILAP